ncbi:MAG TPA: alkaline phosphatase family protein [Vicinamibacterales bacterium]|nr:alkaline phosphatase family protein [Vicinamibacterales bacterium]
MSARVIVVGLDAAEATLVEQWAAEGRLPTMARLIREGRACSLANSLGTLPGAIWPEITTGISGGRMALYYHPRQLHTGEARMRPVRVNEVDPEYFFWTLASRAGRRVAVVDPVQAVPAPAFNGIQLFEWGLHDRTFDIESDPPGLLDEVRARHGDHPIHSCDRHGRQRSGYEHLLDGLLTGVARKTDVLLDLLQRDAWDLFVATYGETHCAGHQFWHFLDPRHPWHEPTAPVRLHNAMASVYQAVDKGLGQLIDAAGPDAVLLVVASHGMGPATGGPQLLPEVLVRLGLGSSSHTGDSWLRRLKAKASRAPTPMVPVLRALAGIGFVKRLQAQSGALLDPLESPLTRAVALRNNRCGAIRLNRTGREPFGRVNAGDEANALMTELRQELLALEDPASRQPIVTEVITATDAFGAGHHPDVPDLMVSFRTDLGTLEVCCSPRVGRVEVPLYHPSLPRSGEHTPNSRLWAFGRGVTAGQPLPDANVLDIAPTVLSLLDVHVARRLDGSPIAIVPPAS